MRPSLSRNSSVVTFATDSASTFTGAGRVTYPSGIFTGPRSVRSFSSLYVPGEMDIQMREKSNLPTATVETVDPMLLSCRIAERCSRCDGDISELPEPVCRCFEDELLLGDDNRRLYAAVGQFAIIRLERDSQLLIPAYDFCMPGKECSNDTETPCDSFRKIRFPVNEFFPPAESDASDDRDESFDPPCRCGR